MKPLAPVERDSQTEELRYEIKAPLSGLQLPQLHASIISHPRAFRCAYPSRWVNNIYFDTWEFDSLNDHLEGIDVHQKFRLRWYGPSLNEIPRAYLELKHKKNRLGTKKVQELNGTLDLGKISWMEVMQYLRSSANDFFLPFLISVRPVLISRFFREYYVTADGETRLTLDYKLKSFDQRFSSAPNIRYCVPLINEVIVELKSSVESSTALARLMADFPFRFEKYSKYVTSLQSMLD
ncbi:MAG: VTC domain-containing protein [Chloroflexi bacterium]|nr:VTC domain-containing protein [Chloroflexota bacterium]